MLRLESLYQYLVPLVFVAIWAMTSLFNRETQPLPPRTGRPPGPGGPRPTPARAPDWRSEQSSRASAPGAPNRPGARRDDDILVIEAEPRRNAAQTGNRVTASNSPPRRGGKARPAGPTAPGRVEPVKPSQLSASLLHPVNPPSIQSEVMSHARALKPLSLPPSPLLTTPNDEAAKAQAGRALVSERDSFSSEEIRKLVQIPARLREGFILAELLKPPVSLRGSSRMPRRGPARES